MSSCDSQQHPTHPRPMRVRSEWPKLPLGVGISNNFSSTAGRPPHQPTTHSTTAPPQHHQRPGLGGSSKWTKEIDHNSTPASSRGRHENSEICADSDHTSPINWTATCVDRRTPAGVVGSYLGAEQQTDKSPQSNLHHGLLRGPPPSAHVATTARLPCPPGRLRNRQLRSSPLFLQLPRHPSRAR